MADTDGIELTLHIAAPPAVVYRYFSDPKRFKSWMGADSELDARPGGGLVVRYPNEAPPARGEVVEAERDRRIVFTWGYTGGANGLDVGASTVAVELKPLEGGTLLTLRHTGLPDRALEQGHLGGWRHYFGVLAWRAAREALAPVLESRIDAFVAAWNEEDPERRRDLLAGCWAPDGLFVDRMGYVPGREAMETFIANARRFMPGVGMERTGPIRETHGRVHFPWRLTGPDGAVVGEGLDVGRLDGEGRFVELAGFWDDPPGGGTA
ncbi:MAG TPA: SRPBCC domain-containing protein [Longimicrobiales bacterium]|nr:SRPBCC domain-containing protein [Longimicrobiales bacterium]